MKCDAVLLDLDGTLIDSIWLYYDAVNHVLSEFGVSCTEEELFARAGASGEELYTHFLKLHGKYDISMEEDLKETYYSIAYEMLPEVSFPKESIHTICTLNDLGYKVAICTGASRKFVNSIVPNGLVDVIVTCDDVSVGKPDPETFLNAADYIGINPSNCTVVGDSMADLLGATSAGMRFILVRHKHNTHIKDGYVREINNITELIT